MILPFNIFWYKMLLSYTYKKGIVNMDYESTRKLLESVHQEHLLKYYDELSEQSKEKLLKQINNVDFSVLKLVENHQTATEKGKLEPLGAVTLDQIKEKETEFRATGVNAIKNTKVGAVLLAGGQGTRLGLDKPKGMLNVGVNKTLYLFEQLINNIMDVVNETGTYIPLYIMTSDKNNEDTVNFFEEQNYFGYNKDYIKFFVQEMAPSCDYNGKLYMDATDTLSLSPNGNGGWFSSLIKAGLIKDINERGVEWLNVFSVDNVLQRIADPVFVGATINAGCVCGSKVVRKAAPEERVGVLCLEDGKPSIVEYYEMTDEIINSRNENGELLYNFGVTLNYLFKVDKLIDIMNKNMPLHIVEKKIPYINENGELVKPESPNGYKFETLVLDMIHLMDNCLSFEIDRKKEFAPIKNRTGVDSLDSARELMKYNNIEF